MRSFREQLNALRNLGDLRAFIKANKDSLEAAFFPPVAPAPAPPPAPVVLAPPPPSAPVVPLPVAPPPGPLVAVVDSGVRDMPVVRDMHAFLRDNGMDVAVCKPSVDAIAHHVHLLEAAVDLANDARLPLGLRKRLVPQIFSS